MQMRLIRNVTLAALVAVGPALAQQPAPATAPSQGTTAPGAAGAKSHSQQDLDTLLAPIALYPDALLAQVLMASTYPLEVVEAARWAKANPSVKDKALQDAMEKQTWEPSVKGLLAVPQVLQQMNEKLDWTQKLGDAFLAQQADVMTTVQTLRGKAAAAGNLKTTAEQTVKTEQQAGKTTYIIESPKPETVYVPTYNPATIYGTWWYSYPPYYMYPPGYAYAPGLAFATGIVVGAAIWGNCNWGGNNVNINVNNYNKVNKTNLQNNNWNHSAQNRKGVAYKDQGVAQKYNRGASPQASQARSQYQGRSDVSASNYGGGDRGAGDRGAGDRGGGDRGAGGGGAQSRSSPSASSRSSGGFSGAGSGASTRSASSRGGASRGGGRGGGRR